MSFLFSAFLLPLLAGFVVSTTLPFLKYAANREDGYRLLLRSTITGFILFLISHVLISYGNGFLVLLEGVGLGSVAELMRFAWRIFTEPFRSSIAGAEMAVTDTGIMTVFVAGALVVGSLVLDRAFPSLRLSYERRALVRYGGPLEQLLSDAMAHGKPVIVTLKSRKVYVGFVEGLPHADPASRRYLKILPAFSGYRDLDSLRLSITQDYRPFLQAINKISSAGDHQGEGRRGNTVKVTLDKASTQYLGERFGTVLAWEEIESASMWIRELHESLRVRPASEPKSPN